VRYSHAMRAAVTAFWGHMTKRRSLKRFLTLQDRLSAWAKQVRDRAAELPPGPEREALLKKASQADTAAHLDDWTNSIGLKPPK
jgi:hypothetical protein